MNNIQLAETAFKAFELDLKIRALEDEAKILKKALVAEAQSRPDEHVALKDSDGTEFIVKFAGGEAHVCFPADKLKASVPSTGAIMDKLVSLVPDNCWHVLFEKSETFLPVAGFRAKCQELLGKAVAPKVVKLCTSASSPKVTFKELDTSAV
jgi:hypothetical protein